MANTWRFTRGIDFTFPPNVTLPPGGYALVVDDDPDEFRDDNINIPAGVPIFSYEGGGGLANSGEELELSRPGAPEPPDSENPGFVPYYTVDRVDYRNRAPWPSDADGNGPSLVKRSPLAYSNDAANWMLGVVNGSPGEAGDPDSVGAKVMQVRVGGTIWARPSVAVSVGSGSQLEPLPWTTIDQITITFSEPVTIGAGALQIESVVGAEYAVTPDVDADTPTLSVTWTIDRAIAADRLELDLESEAVLDGAGNLLDGDWTDATSVFPSGKGTNGGDFRFQFNALPGDVDRNGVVELADQQAVFSRVFNSLGMAEYLDAVDIDGNGKITVADLVRVRNRLGESLPAEAPAAASVLASPLATRSSGVTQRVIAAARPADEQLLQPRRVDAAITAAPSSVMAKLRASRRQIPTRSVSEDGSLLHRQ
jgi:hypothetical protein